MNKKIEALLLVDPDKSIATLGFFRKYNIDECFFEGNSAIAFGKSNQKWTHLISNSKKELLSLLDQYHSKSNYYFSVEEWMVPIISKYGEMEWEMLTNRYILSKDIKVEHANILIKSIDDSYAGFIQNNSDYKDYTSVEYICQSLKNEVSAGVFERQKLVAWAFTHDDGSLGFLHVLKEYRQRGYAKQLLLSLIHQKRERNESIFCNVLPNNKAAIGLVSKLGFNFDRKVSWLKLK